MYAEAQKKYTTIATSYANSTWWPEEPPQNQTEIRWPGEFTDADGEIGETNPRMNKNNTWTWLPWKGFTLPEDQPLYAECNTNDPDIPNADEWCNKLSNKAPKLWKMETLANGTEVNKTLETTGYEYSGACCMQIKWHRVMWEDVSPIVERNRQIIEEYGYPPVKNFASKFVCANKW